MPPFGPRRGYALYAGFFVINLNDSKQRIKLLQDIEQSRKDRLPYRYTREAAIEEYGGPFFAQLSPKQKASPTVVNLLHQFIETFLLLLVGGRPKAMLTSRFPELFQTARRFGVGLNNLFGEINLEETLRDTLLDAIFREGTVKIYRAEGRGAELGDNEWVEVGRPYVKHLSFDDFGYDMTRTRWEDIRYAWDEYEVSWDKLRHDDFYNPDVVKRMLPDHTRDTEVRAAHISSPAASKDPVFRDERVTLMDVWLPERQELAIMSRYDDSVPPLAAVPDELEGGPYRRLLLGKVPDNIMPTSPTDHLKTIHDVYNRLMRKLINQAQRQKNNDWYTGSASADMETRKNAKDGHTIKINRPNEIGTIESGGVHQGNLAFSGIMEQLFDRHAGNLQAAAALGPQSGTLGQDELIHAGVSRKIGKYQERLTAFTCEVMKAVGQLMWYDKNNVVPGQLAVPGTGQSIPYNWPPEHDDVAREGDFWQYNFRLDPYSMPYESPSTKLAKLQEYVAFLFEALPAIQGDGGGLDTRKIVRRYAELSNQEELSDVVVYNRRDGNGESPAPDRGRQASHTVRENVRRNVSAGPTHDAHSRMMQDMLLGNGDSQNQVTSAAGSV